MSRGIATVKQRVSKDATLGTGTTFHIGTETVKTFTKTEVAFNLLESCKPNFPTSLATEFGIIFLNL
jgi:hypothetical protein